jgi:hypothetical protein
MVKSVNAQPFDDARANKCLSEGPKFGPATECALLDSTSRTSAADLEGCETQIQLTGRMQDLTQKGGPSSEVPFV